MKWYHKILKTLSNTVFSFILLIISLIVVILNIPKFFKGKKEYKNSSYYKDLNLPYKSWRLHSPEYRFYNGMKDRNISVDYVVQESNGVEYFIYSGVLFFFPDFDQAEYDNEKSEWVFSFDGVPTDFDSSYEDLISKLDRDVSDMSVKVLAERKMFLADDLTDMEIPRDIFLTWSYETAFDNEDSPLKMIVPRSTRDLYEMMLATPELCGDFVLGEDNSIYWDLYENIRITMRMDSREAYLDISKKPAVGGKRVITHWHPSPYEIYEEIYKIGKRGNVLVVGDASDGASVLYMGDEKLCPYSPGEDAFGGKVYCLKAE